MAEPFYAHFEGGPLAGVSRVVSSPREIVHVWDSDPPLAELWEPSENYGKVKVATHTYTRHERTGRFSWVFRCDCGTCKGERHG